MTAGCRLARYKPEQQCLLPYWTCWLSRQFKPSSLPGVEPPYLNSSHPNKHHHWSHLTAPVTSHPGVPSLDTASIWSTASAPHLVGCPTFSAYPEPPVTHSHIEYSVRGLVGPPDGRLCPAFTNHSRHSRSPNVLIALTLPETGRRVVKSRAHQQLRQCQRAVKPEENLWRYTDEWIRWIKSWSHLGVCSGQDSGGQWVSFVLHEKQWLLCTTCTKTINKSTYIQLWCAELLG